MKISPPENETFLGLVMLLVIGFVGLMAFAVGSTWIILYMAKGYPPF